MSRDYTDIQVRLLVGSPGASTTQSDSPGPSMTPSYTSGPSTTPSYSLGPSRNAECANCKLLIGKLQVLEATLEMHMHPEKHTIDSTALLYELYNDMGKFSLSIIFIEKLKGNQTFYGSKWDVLCPVYCVKVSIKNVGYSLDGAQPHRALARLAWRFGPIVRLQLGEVSAIFVVYPSVAQKFKSRQFYDKIFTVDEHDLHVEICGGVDAGSGMRKEHVVEDAHGLMSFLCDVISGPSDGGLEIPLTLDNIKAVILDVFSAGTDTSAVTIEWTMSELMKNPRVMKKVQAEVRYTLQGKEKIHESDIKGLDYLKIVIMETLRLHPPLPLLLPRECRENCVIAGYNIPVKTKVIINMWKIARDPDYWTEPESFIPERFSESSINMMGQDFEYFPFGSGRRMCPGMMLGLANSEIVLVMLLYHFNWELPNGARSEDLDMKEVLGATLKRKNPLILVPALYNPQD
ncbi:putative oxidoreductase [Tanacetum coccineum]